MTPADLLTLAADIETDTRIGRLARAITCAVLRGRADRMKTAGKEAGMVGNMAATARMDTSEAAPDLTPEPPLTTSTVRSPR